MKERAARREEERKAAEEVEVEEDYDDMVDGLPPSGDKPEPFLDGDFVRSMTSNSLQIK